MHHSILKRQLNKRLPRLQGHHRGDRLRVPLVLVLHQVAPLKADHPVQIQGHVPDSRRVWRQLQLNTVGLPDKTVLQRLT
jgi:hypothetical protein